jgi:hypothetical protein
VGELGSIAVEIRNGAGVKSSLKSRRKLQYEKRKLDGAAGWLLKVASTDYL